MRVGAMGDILHALPAVAALRKARPEWEIGWAVEPRWRALLETENAGRVELQGRSKPVVDRVHAVRTRDWSSKPVSVETAKSVAALRSELRRERYDVCVDMQGSMRSAVIGWMAGAIRYVGPAEPREKPARWVYGVRVRTRSSHVVEQGCELLGEAVGLHLDPTTVELPCDPDAEAWSEGITRDLGRFVFVAPTAGWGAKEWPAARFGEVARRLGQAGFRTLVNATSAHDAVARAVVETAGGFAMTVPCSIAEMIAIVRRSTLVIAGDTGPMHLAAALRRPVVGLFGPTDPERNGPYGTRSRVLRHGAPRRDHRRLAEPEAGLLEITTEEVVAAAREMLDSETEVGGEV